MSRLPKSMLITSALAVVPLLWSFSANATAIPITTNLIDNGQFGTSLINWTTSGTVNRRTGGDSLDNSTGNRGFNNFFGDSAFAALGDVSGDASLAAFDDVHSIEQSFMLASMIGGESVFSYTLDVSFAAVFEGRDGPTVPGSLSDVFTVILYTPTGSLTLLSANSSGFPDTFCTTGATGTCTTQNAAFNQQLSWNPFTAQISGLTAGAYTLKFILNEAFDPADETWFTNTAVGIDRVRITGTAYVPEPGTLALLGLGLVGLGLSRRRKAE